MDPDSFHFDADANELLIHGRQFAVDELDDADLQQGDAADVLDELDSLGGDGPDAADLQQSDAASELDELGSLEGMVRTTWTSRWTGTSRTTRAFSRARLRVCQTCSVSNVWCRGASAGASKIV